MRIFFKYRPYPVVYCFKNLRTCANTWSCGGAGDSYDEMINYLGNTPSIEFCNKSVSIQQLYYCAEMMTRADIDLMNQQVIMIVIHELPQ